MTNAALRRQAADLIRETRAALAPRREADPHAYAGQPVAFAEDVLGIATLTDDQKRILRLLHEPPYRVLVPSAHDVGKTFIAAVAALYWYFSFDPGLVLTTAPTERDVIDLLWTEIRLLADRAPTPLVPPFTGPKAPEIYGHADHYAKGYVSRKNQGFQGRHRPRMLFIKDEANDVDALHWITTRTMFDPDLGHAELAIFNPTSTTSQAYQEDMLADDADGKPRWHRVRLSALNHPNVVRELNKQEKEVRGAVSLAMVEEWVRDWTEPVVDPADVRATDVEWPPGSSKYIRPAPLFQARAMGVWPDTGDGVWSPSVWEACVKRPAAEVPSLHPLTQLPEIGADCATGHGDDYFALHVRWGPVSVYHETSNTMNPARIFERLKLAAGKAAALVNGHRPPAAKPVLPGDITIKIDDDGTGGAVGAFLGQAGYSVYLVGAGCAAMDDARYPRRRDELWFQVAEKARRGLVNLAMLDGQTRARLRQQLLAPAWQFDLAGRRVVEKKEDTKEKIGRSPDDADAMNLAYLEGVAYPKVALIDNPRPDWSPQARPGQQSAARRRKLFGLS
jgi:hypothetical protein